MSDTEQIPACPQCGATPQLLTAQQLTGSVVHYRVCCPRCARQTKPSTFRTVALWSWRSGNPKRVVPGYTTNTAVFMDVVQAVVADRLYWREIEKLLCRYQDDPTGPHRQDGAKPHARSYYLLKSWINKLALAACAEGMEE